MKKIILLFLCISAFLASSAQQINLKTGDGFSIRSEDVEPGAMGKNEQYTFQFKVIEKSAAEYKLQCTLIKAKIKRAAYKNTPITLNTDSIRSSTFNYTGLITTLLILQKPLTAVISTKGKLLRIEGYDELMQDAVSRLKLSVYMQDQIKNNLKTFPSAIIKKMFFEWPAATIGYQSTWTNLEGDTRYTVTAIRGSVLDVVLSNKEKTLLGSYTLNDVNGLLENAFVTFNKDNTPKSSPQNIYKQVITYGVNAGLPADTAWINMAITLSYFSDALISKTNNADSAKTFAYFAAHDEKYKNDRYYRAHKLTFIQRVGGNRIYDHYNTELVNTPNKYLAGEPAHLYNKVYQVLPLNVDSALLLATYLSKESNFDDWLQDTFAQNFLPSDLNEAWKKERLKDGTTEKELDAIITRDKNSRINSYLLLDRLYAEKKNRLMQQKINALYLWVNAKKGGNNQDALIKTVGQFNKMDDSYMKEGNGGRYGLLIYTLLVDAGKQKIANTVLNKTIGDLEKYAADTLYTSHYAARNLLAHAYYLKYQSVKSTDTIAALVYLAKAAQYSPLKAKEKVTASFYDRDFLKSKESYREEYINKLFEHGDSDDALKIFADHVSSSYERLDDMQAIYEAHFPGKSFKDFVAQHVISTWQPAPDFVLKGIDGKDRSLADYKGKWLVADFWGTWCVPCRAEMPQVNTFNNEIKAGKHSGIVLLGIACRDMDTDVKKFLENNNYGITVAMGNDVIAKSYNITGYPTKVIVTPDGKMLATAFGSDWSAIVDKLSKLYKAE